MVSNYNNMSKRNTSKPNPEPSAPKQQRSRISTIAKHKGTGERLPDHEMRERYDALMRSQECVFLLDLKGNFVSSNDAAQALLGFPCDGKRALNIADILTGEQLQVAEAALQETILIGSLPELRYFDLKDSDGRRLVLSVRTSLVFRDSSPHLVMGIARDMTAHHRVRKELERSRLLNAAAQAAVAAVHEMKNKMSAIVGYAGLILHKVKDNDPSSIADTARSLLEASDRALNLSMETMRLATLGKRKREPVNLNLFLTELVAEIQTKQARDFHNFEIDMDLGDDVEFLADPDQLKMAFSNIIMNAMDAMPVGGTLLVTTEKMGGEAKVTISDTGEGIQSEVINSIFEPFVTTKGDKGTGLGLAISWRMLENHGAKIDVISEPGQGTTFEITLPFSSESP